MVVEDDRDEEQDDWKRRSWCDGMKGIKRNGSGQ